VVENYELFGSTFKLNSAILERHGPVSGMITVNPLNRCRISGMSNQCLAFCGSRHFLPHIFCDIERFDANRENFENFCDCRRNRSDNNLTLTMSTLPIEFIFKHSLLNENSCAGENLLGTDVSMSFLASGKEKTA